MSRPPGLHWGLPSPLVLIQWDVSQPQAALFVNSRSCDHAELEMASPGDHLTFSQQKGSVMLGKDTMQGGNLTPKHVK